MTDSEDRAAATAAPAVRPAHSDRVMVLLLAAICVAGPVALNIYLPALPAVQRAFGASVPEVQLSLTTGLLVFAAGLLIYGPLSDRFGRRPVVLCGLGIFLSGTLLCLVAPTLEWLIAGRAVQSLGMAAGLTVARAIVSDLYPRENMARMIAYLTMAMVIGPTISPSIGGVLVVQFGWRSVFIFLLAAGLLIFWTAWRLLPETLTRDKARPLNVPFLARSAAELLRKRAFVAYTFQASVIFAVFLVFISVTPYVMVNGLGRAPTEYGLYYLLVAVGYFIGNWTVTRFALRKDLHSLMRTGTTIAAASAAMALGLHALGFSHPIWIFLPMATLAFGQGMTLPNVTASVVSLAPEQSGLASSLLGFIQQSVAAVCVQWMGLFPVDTPMPMLTFCALGSVLGMLVLELRR